MKRRGDIFEREVTFDHLVRCARRAARGKRHRPDVRAFLFRLERHAIDLEQALLDGTWMPGPYREFAVTDPKPRQISAAPFRDRVVHHVLVDMLEPRFEPAFIHDSYACRVGKGTHLALKRYRQWAPSSRYVLKMDVQLYFPSVDHAILMQLLARRVKDPRVLELARRIVEGSNPQQPAMFYFPGDDLFTPMERRKGLPIGNQTSQFFANVYLDPLDHFVKERLRVRRYLRYMDDMVILGDSRPALWRIFSQIQEFAYTLRLRLHPRKCFVAPVTEGLRLLGYRVFRDHARLAPDNLARARRRLHRLRDGVEAGTVDLSAFKASLRAWIGHAMHADSWRMREKMLSDLIIKLPAPGFPAGESTSEERG